MKREFSHDDFEDFLKRSADSLRMKAPDRVWQNLSKELGVRRRRLFAGLGLFLLVTSAAGYFIVSNTQTPVHSTRQLDLQTGTGDKSSPARSQATQDIVSAVPENIKPLYPVAKATNSAGRKLGKLVDFSSVALSSRLNKVHDSQPLADLPIQTELATNSFEPTVVDSYTEFDGESLDNKKNLNPQQQKVDEVLPYSIESVVNAYRNKGRKKRFETQLYFTPTISYRKLAENKTYLRSLDPATAVPASYPGLNSSVNNNVTHKPDVGFELGFAAKYAISRKVKLRTGLQFNVNRYDVKAFSSSLSPATIALNSGTRVDSLNTYSTYSNVAGYKSNWLQNLSFQVSIPVGIEYVFASTNDLQLGVAGTVQPTYVLGDRAYLITTDYKSYTQVPWLIRRWNVNTSFEAFVTYKKLQFGPQVRYQLLSSFVSKYPVKENLFDFGLKLGISLNK